jgi:signal transduction histidine kinase
MRILRHIVFKIATLAVCYAAAIAALSSLSRRFGDYTRIYFQWDVAPDAAAPAPFLAVGALGLFCASLMESEPSKNALPRRLNEVDFLLFAASAAGVAFLSSYLLDVGGMNVYKFALRPFGASGAGVALAATTTARIRDGRFSRTLYWIEFFGTHRINTPPGAVMALLLAGDLLRICATLAGGCRAVISGYRVPVDMPAFLFALVTLAALTFLCRFILNLEVSYGKANEDKIRSEHFKVELITNVSHDIRTPLTSIINYVDLIKRRPAADTVLTEYVGVLERKSQRLKTLIGDLIEASKAGTGYIRVDPREIDLAEIIGQIAGEFDEVFADNRLTFVFSPPREKAVVTADGSLLWRVAENIFGNAAKYAAPDTRVYADIARTDGTISFSLKNVSKEPLNMSPDELLERFVRGDRARSGEGSGLGLYIAQNLTELMGGRFEIRISGDSFEAAVSFGG